MFSFFRESRERKKERTGAAVSCECEKKNQYLFFFEKEGKKWRRENINIGLFFLITRAL